MSPKLRTLVIISLSLLVAALGFKSGDLLWLVFPFLAYLGVGLLHFPATDSVCVQAQRQIRQAHFDGAPVLEMTVTLCNQGAAIPVLRVVDALPEGGKLVTGSPEMTSFVDWGEEVRLNYAFAQKRGRYRWNTIRVWVGDPFGLMSVELSLAAPAEISVQPEVENFRRLPLRPNSTLHSPGSIPARLAGTGTDFWGVRLYQPGDALRWLNWRMNARHPGQLYTKEFEQEEVADIGLILDARSETDLRVGADSLFEHSVRAAASLADGLIHQGHRVGLLALGKTIFQVFPGYGKNQLNRILGCLAMIQSSSTGETIGLHYLPLGIFARGALLVVLSPLTRSDSLFFPRLRASGYQGLLISPDPYDFLASSQAQERLSQQALALARQERRVQLSAIARLHLQVIDWPVRQPLYPLVRSAFVRDRGQREKWGGNAA